MVKNVNAKQLEQVVSAYLESGRKDTLFVASYTGMGKTAIIEKVINSYGIEEGMTRALILRHRDANKKNGNKAKLDAYSEIFNLYNGDYLAAYNAALAEFEMGHGSRARDWCQKALDINPR